MKEVKSEKIIYNHKTDSNIKIFFQSKPTPKLDQLIAIVSRISKDNEKFSDDVRKEMNDLIQARWG